MKVKGMLTAAMLIAAMALTQVPCFAMNLDYSGPINNFTGEPTNVGGNSLDQDRILISSGIYYDRTTRSYVYDLGGRSDQTISASIMDGMIVNEPVRLEIAQGLDIRLYCDGVPVEEADLALIEAPGRYVLEARLLEDQYVRIMGFTIVGATTGLINSYPMPAGFVVTDVEMTVQNENGEWVGAASQWDRNKVSLSENGNYRIRYECGRTGLGYILQTTIDHTPPTLALENVVNGLAKGPVDISDLEENCKIGISLNGGKMTYREELTLSGDYEIILQDEAGNVTNYSFTLLPYLDLHSWIFFGLVVMMVAGTGIYLYIERKRMRIR